MNGKVDWLGGEVLDAVLGLTDEALLELGFEIEGQTKININQLDLIDTGFLVNSPYVVAQNGESSYEQAKAEAITAGSTKGAKSGQANSAEMAEKATFENDRQRVAVAIGAEYAIYPETKTPFFYPAAKQKVAEFGGILKSKAKEAGL